MDAAEAAEAGRADAAAAWANEYEFLPGDVLRGDDAFSRVVGGAAAVAAVCVPAGMLAELSQ